MPSYYTSLLYTMPKDILAILSAIHLATTKGVSAEQLPQILSQITQIIELLELQGQESSTYLTETLDVVTKIILQLHNPHITDIATRKESTDSTLRLLTV